MPPTSQPSPSPSDTLFVRAAKAVFEDCETMEDLERVREHMAADKIATREEKRVLRKHYATVRTYLEELKAEEERLG